MKDEHWLYTYGAARQGNVDCSGAFVWAYKQFGKSIYHGSNRMARVEVEKLIPIGQAAPVPGMAAFKRRAPGDSAYALPDEYKPGGAQYTGDVNDYYHVGLIAPDTAQVLNARSAASGFVQSPITQGWSHIAYLKQVDYAAAGDDTPAVPAPPTSQTATVWAANGKPVKMRNLPLADDNRTVWDWVPLGATVTVRAPSADGWVPITYHGKNGYMMYRFLRYADPTAQEGGETDE